MNYTLFDDTQLNPNQKVVDAITKRVLANDGLCPCVQETTIKEDLICPCKQYREIHYCCCTLYVRKYC